MCGMEEFGELGRNLLFAKVFVFVVIIVVGVGVVRDLNLFEGFGAREEFAVPAIGSGCRAGPHLCTMARICTSQGQGQGPEERGLFVCYVVRLADH